VLYGGRLSLIIVASALLLALTLGTGVGVLAGYLEGLTDHLVGRVIDVLMALPGILLAITILAYVGRGFVPLVFALSATAWVGYARLARSVTLSVKQREFATAGTAAGGRTSHILRRHILPNTVSVLLVQATAGAAGVMLSEAGLSFLGLGVQPPNPSWGEMLATGCDYLLEAPHLALIPGALLFLTVWALNTLGEELSRAISPKRRLLATGL
jgi:peptide/nickel transport system permease protein